MRSQQAHRVTLILIVFLAIGLLALPALAQRGDDADRKSKNGKAEGTIDGVEVAIQYGRPNVKGREIWGGLVPYGQVWRTGADEATTFTVSRDVQIEGQKLAAGTYALFTIPGEKEWTVIFNTEPHQWGAFSYDEGKDALRVSAQPDQSEHVESLTFAVEGESVVLKWEKLAVPFKVAAAK